MSAEFQLKNNSKLTLETEVNQLFSPDSYTGEMMRTKGPRALLRYLNTPQTYSVATTAATWGLPSTIFGQKVVLGHHCLIRLPGKRIIEWTNEDRRSWEGHLRTMTQLELRTGTGKHIEGMWKTHCELIPKYRAWGSLLEDSPEGLIHYMPFKNDCFTYADRVLTENEQAPQRLERVTPKDYRFGPGQDKD